MESQQTCCTVHDILPTTARGVNPTLTNHLLLSTNRQNLSDSLSTHKRRHARVSQGCSKLLALEAASNSTRLPGGMKFQLSFTVTKLLPSNGSFIVLPLNSHTGFVYVFDSGRSPTIRYPAFFLQKSMSLRGALNMLSFCH